MSALGASLISPEEYLKRERLAETKSEYFDGQIFAMAGGTPIHALIGANVIWTLRTALQGTKCSIYSSDLRVSVAASGLFTYPDVTVICGELQYADDQRDTITNPTLIVEVLSDSTRDYDRGRKFHMYRELPSLLTYLTVAQDEMRVEQWTRATRPGQWLFMEHRGNTTISLDLSSLSIEADLPLVTFYEGVLFPNRNFTV